MAIKLDLFLQPKQLLAFESKATELLFGGSCGGGKSHMMRVASIIWCLEIPGLQVFLFRRQYKDLVSSHLPGAGGYYALLGPLIQAKKCKIIGDERIEFFNGSCIRLSHCQYESDAVSKYQGAEIHVLMIDELTHFTDSIYRFLRSRNRIGALKIPDKYKGMFPRIVCSANPGGVGHLFVKQMFIDPKPAFEVWETPKEEGGKLRQFIPSFLSDNPMMNDNDPNYINSLHGLGDPDLVRAMLEGDWDVVSGAFFGFVWDAKSLVIPKFSLENTSWYKDRSYDYGMSKPSAVAFFTESDGSSIRDAEGKEFWMPKGSLLMFDEYYTWTGKANEGNRELARETARHIKEMEDGMPFIVHPGPADNAIFNTEYDASKISSAMEAEGISWTRSDKSGGSRSSGWAKMAQMMKAACDRDPEQPWLMFMDNCRNAIRTLPVLPRDESKTEDIDTKSEDHMADAIRYRVGRDKPVMRVGKVVGL